MYNLGNTNKYSIVYNKTLEYTYHTKIQLFNGSNNFFDIMEMYAT